MTVKARVDRLEAEFAAATPDVAERALLIDMLGTQAAPGPVPSDDDLVRHGTPLALRVLAARQRIGKPVPPATLPWTSRRNTDQGEPS